MNPTRGLALAAAVAALAACSAKAPSSANTDSHAPGTTLANTPAACASYPTGTPGVIRTFCDGSATVKVNVAGLDHALTGGTCSTSPVFSVNLGVVSDNQLGGPKPDYFGLTVMTPGADGSFTNGVLVVTVGGKSYPVTKNSGTTSPSGGTFSGTSLKGEAISGSFTC